MLDYPVVSGNVSLYNETNGVGIPPTPAIGGVGLVPDVSQDRRHRLEARRRLLIVIGRERGWLGQSLYQQVVAGELEGAPPPVDLADEIKGRTSGPRADPRSQGFGRARLRGWRDFWWRSPKWRLPAIRALELFPYEGKLPAHAVVVRRGSGPLCRRRRAGTCRGNTGARPAAGASRPHHRPRRRRHHHPSRRRGPLPARRPARHPRRLAAGIYGRTVIRPLSHRAAFDRLY